MQKKNLFVKLKEDKGARAIALTVTIMLLVLTAIIITTVVANRATNTPTPDDSQQAGVNDPNTDETPDDKPDETPDNTQKPDDSQTNTDVLPEHFLLPVSGVMQQKHDSALQVFSPTMGDYRVHLGIDIGTVAGASVSAHSVEKHTAAESVTENCW